MYCLPCPIERNSEAWKTVSAHLQGNILNPFPGDFTRLILFKFGPRTPAVEEETVRSGQIKAQLAELAKAWVTPADKQDASYLAHKEIEQLRKPDAGRRKDWEDRIRTLEPFVLNRFGNLFLTVCGYRALGYSDDELLKNFPHPQGDQAFRNWFLERMEYQGRWLGDPAPGAWQPDYRGRIDAMLLLTASNEKDLDIDAEKAREKIKAGLGVIVAEEKGTRHKREITGEDGKKKNIPVEHFGFADGISEPRFFAEDREEHPDDLNDADIVLFEDRLAPGRAFGSFLVYRKLEQNVKGFHEAASRLADYLKLERGDPRAEAMIIGRFPDGTPLTKYSSERQMPENNFTYVDDSRGWKCPLHAHIRKVRPRQEITNHRRRMVRRGVPYGDYDPIDGKNHPESGSGLLFMAFMRNLHSQFGSVQKEWANSADFPAPRTGVDSLIGQNHGRTQPSWPVRWGEEESKPFRFGDYLDKHGKPLLTEVQHYVTLQGGAFFFAPSLAFFDSLAQSGSVASSRSVGRVPGGTAQSRRKKTGAKVGKVIAPKPGSPKTLAKSSSPSGGTSKYRT